MNNALRSSTILIALIFIVKMSFAQITLTLQPNAVDGKDAGVSSLFPSTNYPIADELVAMAWTSGGNFVIGRTFIDFDLSSIPTNAVIQSATLFLYSPEVSTKNPMLHNNYANSPYPLTNETFVQRITSNWTETTLTWNNQPNTTTLNEVQVAASTSQNQDFQIPITGLVQDYVSSPSTSFGFMYRLQTEVNYRSLIFSSSDHVTPALRPKLVVTYTYPVSTADLQVENQFSLFPNPAKGILNITDINKSTEFEIYNIYGSKVLSLDGNSNSLKIDISSWTTGLYLIRAIDRNGKHLRNQKFIKE